MNLLLILLLLMPYKNILADVNPLATVDVYGTKIISAEDVSSQYKSDISDIANAVKHGAPPIAIDRLIFNIKTSYNFAYVGVTPIKYQNDPIIHITIDIVEKAKDISLYYFSPKPLQTIPDKHHLISAWLEYEKIGFDIVLKTNKFPAIKSCPAQHCLFGFDHKSLHRFKSIFDCAELYKAELVDIIRLDKDETKRAAAVFVLAHIKNPNELFKLLLPTMHDPSAIVRNNVMRVLGSVLSQHKITTIPIKSIIQALNYPATTDRNKALYMIYSLADDKKNALYIKKYASQSLIETLKLQQPNNHDFSYQILKKISGKNYGERDYKAWQQWLERDIS